MAATENVLKLARRHVVAKESRRRVEDVSNTVLIVAAFAPAAIGSKCEADILKEGFFFLEVNRGGFR